MSPLLRRSGPAWPRRCRRRALRHLLQRRAAAAAPAGGAGGSAPKIAGLARWGHCTRPPDAALRSDGQRGAPRGGKGASDCPGPALQPPIRAHPTRSTRRWDQLLTWRAQTPRGGGPRTRGLRVRVGGERLSAPPSARQRPLIDALRPQLGAAAPLRTPGDEISRPAAHPRGGPRSPEPASCGGPWLLLRWCADDGGGGRGEWRPWGGRAGPGGPRPCAALRARPPAFPAFARPPPGRAPGPPSWVQHVGCKVQGRTPRPAQLPTSPALRTSRAQHSAHKHSTHAITGG